MSSLRAWCARFGGFFGKERKDRELAAELDAHVQMHVEDNVRRGMSPEEARRQALIALGGIEQTKESYRGRRGIPVIESVLQDVRFGARMLRKNPGFTAVAVLTLALGIGANTAIFSVVYAAVLRPLPYAQPDRLMTLDELRESHEYRAYWNASYPDYLDWQSQARTFQSLTGFTRDDFTLRGAGAPQIIFAVQSTTNFFATLGVRPMLGRDFVAGEDVATGPNVAILTYKFWVAYFGRDPQVIGRAMELDDKSVNIIGVLPREFEFAPVGDAGIWVPLHLETDFATRRNLRWMPVIGRLARGVTPAQAAAEMKAINARLAADYPEANGATEVVMTPLRDRIVGQIEPILLILFGAVGFVLLIACANVSSLLAVRATGRRREFAIRAALGGRRGRLITQLLTESLLLAAAGAGLGFFIAQWGAEFLIAAIPSPLLDSMPFLSDVRPSGMVFAFLCAVAVFTALLFGIIPALQLSREGIGEAIKEDTRATAGGAGTRLRDMLVVIEIAFSLVLLAGAGLTVKSLAALLRRNPGFEAQNLLTFDVNLPDTSYPASTDVIRFDRAFRDRLRTVPGLMGIGNTSVVPLTGGGNTIRFVIEGRPMAAGHEYECKDRSASVDYLSLMKIPLLAGRSFDDSADSAESPKHVLVNQIWVNEYLHGENPLGKRIRFTNSPTQPYREIVGVVGNIADAQLDSPEEPALYLPFAQDTNHYISYVARTAGDPESALGAIRADLHDVDSQLVVIRPATMDEIISSSPSVFLRRYPSYLIGGFAGLAVILATIGLYGLISYSVAQRTREIGVRMALGAQRKDVVRLVVAQGIKLTVVGVAIGTAAGLALARLMGSILYGVTAYDPATFALVAIGLLGVAVLACCIPALRAMRVDPTVALHYE